jgi:hypothetical protein
MLRTISLGLAALAGLLSLASAAEAQVFVRAPFVRVRVGGPGVYVRAPFVNLYVPSGPRYYIAPPPPIIMPGPVIVPEPAVTPPPPAEAPVEDLPAPAVLSRAPTLKEFAQTFQPKQGNYEVVLLNPATNQPTTVRFSLPAGTPRRVEVNRRDIEFNYGPRQYVRIQFDRDGAEVVSR